MQVNPTERRRPFISMDERGRVLHNGNVTRVELRKQVVSVGCTDATIETLRFLISEHEKHFPDCPAYVLQTGE